MMEARHGLGSLFIDLRSITYSFVVFESVFRGNDHVLSMSGEKENCTGLYARST